MSDLADMFAELRGCCLHDPQWLPEDVERIIAWHGDRQTGSESSSVVIVQLRPGGEKRQGDYGLLTQSEDYTGHGCQCGSMTVREGSLAKLLGHLDEAELTGLLTRD